MTEIAVPAQAGTHLPTTAPGCRVGPGFCRGCGLIVLVCKSMRPGPKPALSAGIEVFYDPDRASRNTEAKFGTAPPRRLDRGAVGLDRRRDAPARGRVDISPVAGGNRRNRGGDAGRAGARARHRRHHPRRFPAADARAGARPAARRGGGRARFRAVARHAGRGSADRGERDRLLGGRRLFRQGPLAECQGAPARPRLRSGARAERDQPAICAAMRPPSGRISISTAATSSRCYASSGRNRAGNRCWSAR